jgi:hypothetical protein
MRAFDDLPGPQLRGTGGTLNLMDSLLRPGPPAASIFNRSPVGTVEGGTDLNGPSKPR